MRVTVRVVNLLTKLSPLGQIAVFLLLLSVPWLTATQGSGFEGVAVQPNANFDHARWTSCAEIFAGSRGWVRFVSQRKGCLLGASQKET
jgi:hypothetical protein